MSPQRKIQITEDGAQPSEAIAAPYMHKPLGGQIALWHDQINAAFRDGAPYPYHIANDPVELVISQISRWSGPAIFLAALAGILYVL